VSGSDNGLTPEAGDNANVVKTDTACTNGAIHVIDVVILPK
jgi:uncharacterized surface protein with fasciclin (FAS1) repeats